MAKFSPILGRLSGSIGSDTFAHNRGGDYVRKRSNPVNPNTPRQQAVRGWLTQLSTAWQALTDAQRDEWEVWASTHPQQDSLGNQYFMTGLNAFLSLNSRVLDFGGTVVNTAPVTDFTTQLLTMSVVRTTDATATITYTGTPLPAGTRLRVFMCQPAAGNRNPNFKQARLCGYSAAAQASPYVSPLPFAWQVGATTTFFVGIVNSDGQVTGLLAQKATG